MFGNRVMRIVSPVLAIWYLLCVVGFDVHRCLYSGEHFVSSLVAGLPGENIHPECDHDAWSDCHSHGISGRACCVDDINVLTLAGINDDDDNFLCDPDLYCPLLSNMEPGAGGTAQENAHRIQYSRSAPHIMSDGIFSLFSVWRI